MTKRDIASMIRLTGAYPHGYTVRAGGFDGLEDIEVPTIYVGHAIVRALRAEAAVRPHAFMPTGYGKLKSPQ